MCRRALTSLEMFCCEGPKKSKHVYGDLLDRLPFVPREELLEAFPRTPVLAQRNLGGPDPESMKCQIDAAEAILSYGCYRDGHMDHCYQCDKCCPLWALKADDAQYRECKAHVYVAGLPCEDWSRCGAQQGCGGPSMLPCVVWLQEVLQRKPSHVVIECAPDQPDEIIAMWLSKDYWQDSVVISPEDFGWPVSRSRKSMGLQLSACRDMNSVDQ